MCISVLLPEPDEPMTATNSPRLISRSMPLSASTPVAPSPYVFVRLATLTVIGGGGGVNGTTTVGGGAGARTGGGGADGATGGACGPEIACGGADTGDAIVAAAAG